VGALQRPWQQPDQVGGDKAKQAQRRDKQAELANRDPAGRHPRTRAIAVCSLRSRAYRNRPETPVSSNAGWSSSAGVDTVTSREEQTSSSLSKRGPSVSGRMDLPHIARMTPGRAASHRRVRGV
jgi:hypothetical protein